MHLLYVRLLMTMLVIHTCHNKLNRTGKCVDRSVQFTSKFGIVSWVDGLDNQGSSSFNFNSSFVRKRNRRMFLDTIAVIDYHFEKCTVYHNAKGNALNRIMCISVVPHQVGITTIVKVAWIRRFLGERRIHTP